MRESTKLVAAIVGSGGAGLLLIAGIALEWPGFAGMPTWIFYVGGALVFVAAFSATGIGPVGKRLDKLLQEGR